MVQLALSVTFCYQFKSEYYDKVKLNSCISMAVDDVDQSYNDINVIYDPIPEGLRADVILDNITKTIEKSHVVIFEISDINPNVLYELGLAKGLKKPVIILRNESCNEPLPTDINNFLYVSYCAQKLDSFKYTLANKIKSLIDDYSSEDLISASLREAIISEKLSVLKDKSTFSSTVKEFIKQTETNIYYIGSMGFLSNGVDWLADYKENLSEKVFSRIVFVKTLKEIYEIYNNDEILNDYCFWLAQNYILVKDQVITLNSSPDVGIWKSGMSVIVSDEKKLLVSTGTFQDFNNKGFVINDANIASMFKEYAKTLAVTSKRISHRNFGEFFSLSDKTKVMPDKILNVIEQQDYDNLQTACVDYVADELEKLSL